MKVRETTVAEPAARRHIIRRPRLTGMLDESGARIILLVAPAGYGKTTLAREWLEDPSRRSAWYRGGPASADVAALAVGLANAATSIVPHAGRRMHQRLRATDRPEAEVDVLAEMLGDDLADWPNDAWLVIDDYHYAAGIVEAEAFVDALAQNPRLRMLITSRRRPSWAVARRRVYRELLEVERTTLAMDDHEARSVLDIRDGADPSDFLARAAGWPVILGIAALTRGFGAHDRDVPQTLLEYFAEELYQTVPELQWAFCQLAIPPTVPRELAEALLGGENASAVIDQAATLGLFSTDRSEGLEIHPLLRQFLHSKLSEHPRDLVQSAVATVGQFLIEARKWDEAFDVASRFDDRRLLLGLVRAGLEEVLSDGRTMTVQRWIEFAADRYLASPLLDLAEAELAFRQGNFPQTRLLAYQAARGLQAERDAELAALAYARAGRAAHLEGRGSESVAHHQAALELTKTRETAREASWGQFSVLVERGDIESAEIALRNFEELDDGKIDDVLRLHSGRYIASRHAGRASDVGLLAEVLPLLDRCVNPMVRSSFLNTCAGAFAVEGRYDEAERTATQQIHEAELYRLDFVLPHGYLRRAAALCGLRSYREAFHLLDQAARLTRGFDQQWVETATAITRGLALLATQQFDEAIHECQPQRNEIADVLAAEYTAFQALALACSGHIPEAEKHLAAAEAASRALEVTTICGFARAIGSHRASRASGREDSLRAFDYAATNKAIDYFVISYRACPDLLETIASTADARLPTILARARDQDLARRVGLELPPPDRPRGVLSPREREVWELLALGLTNREIAKRLYVSESTIKVHARHIFEKLGARTRVEAVVKGLEFFER